MPREDPRAPRTAPRTEAVGADSERFRDALQVSLHSPDPASVEAAIERGRTALADSDDDPGRGEILSDLGGLLQTRYHQTGDFGCLQEAVHMVTEAYLLSYE